MPENFYTTGEFSKRANVSVRTIRYYDEVGLLKPSLMKESGYRFYTDKDFAVLQRILALKMLGFSLEEINEISVKYTDSAYVRESLNLQQKLLKEKIAALKQMERIIKKTAQALPETEEPDWKHMVSLIHLLSMEETLIDQYKTSKNLEVRIDLHKRYSKNPETWYQWIYDKLPLNKGCRVLEVGCGNGELWYENQGRLPSDTIVLLSDISSGMLRNAASRLKGIPGDYQYKQFDMENIPYETGTFDHVIANHVLFYAKDRKKALTELKRVLKPAGCLCLSTYGKKHMQEIEALAKEYDERIALSEVKLFDIFGLDNGSEELEELFQAVEKHCYSDSLLVKEVKPLADFIYSCHGNQMRYLKDSKEDFEKFLAAKLGKKGLMVTKEAGIFLCYH